MSLRFLMAASVLSLSLPVMAATNVTQSSATASPDAPVVLISPGRYTASIMPGINSDMAHKLEDSLGKVPGLEKVNAVSSDSSIHFTVKEGAKVPIANVQNTVTKTDSDAAMSAPILEHSLIPNPGL